MTETAFNNYMAKLAEDTEELTDTEKLLDGFVAGTTAATAINGLSNLLNVMEDQTLPVGHEFARHAKEIVESAPSKPSVLYLQSVPRKMSDLAQGGPLLDFFANPPAFVSSMDRTLDGKFNRVGITGGKYPAALIKENIKHELMGHIHPDILTHSPWMAAMPEPLLALGLRNNTHLMVSPRNNTSILAHEFGHISGDELLHGPTGNGILDKVKGSLARVWEAASGSTDTVLNKIPGVRDVYKFVEDKAPIPMFAKNIIRNAVLAPSPLALAGGTLALSKKVRDAVASLDPTGTAQEVMDKIEENPVATMAIASAPSLLHEAYTMIPGAKMTYSFWDKVNRGGVSSLSSMKGKVSPLLKTLGFLGRNSLPLLGAAAPLAGVALASGVFDKKSEE